MILVSMVALTAAAVGYSSTRTPQFQATATLAVSACVAVENLDSCDPVSGLSYAVERASIYAGTAMTSPVLRLTLENSDIATDRSELASLVSVNQQAGSPLIEVSATHPDPYDAAELANALADALIEYSRESIDSFEPGGTSVAINVVSPALAPVEAVASESRLIPLGGVLGLLLGLGVAVLRWLLSTQLRDSVDAERVSRLDVLAEVPLRRAGTVRSLDATDARSQGAFQALRAIVASRRPDTQSWTIALVTPSDAALVSSVAHGLAEAFAASKQSVALFLLHEGATADEPVGDTTHVLDAPDLSHASALLEAIEQENPLTLGLGRVESDIAVSTPAFADLLAAARERAVVVLLDAAPASRRAEMISTAGLADATLVVVEAGRTRRSELSEIIRTLELVQATPIGIVVVRPKDRRG